MTPPMTPQADSTVIPLKPGTLNIETESAVQDQFEETDLSVSFSFLTRVHEMCASAENHCIPIWDVGEAMGLSEVESEQIASDLQELNMLHYTSLAGDIALTSFGVSEIILARSQPDMPTTHFPALASFSDQMHLPLALDTDAIGELVDRFKQVSGWMSDKDFEQGGSSSGAGVQRSSTERLADELQQQALMWACYENGETISGLALTTSTELNSSIDFLSETLDEKVTRPRALTRSLIQDLEAIQDDLEVLV